jgi:hypothetical protein
LSHPRLPFAKLSCSGRTYVDAVKHKTP